MISQNLSDIIYKNGYKFFHMKTTNSTMYELRKYLSDKNKNCIILSDAQTDGKGRRGNIWESPIGNIYCSISFKNFVQSKDHFLFSILLSVSIKQSLDVFNAREIKFKWPNDLIQEKKKFGGMILETFNIDKLDKYILVGFGININSSPIIKNYKTTHAKLFCDIKNLDEFLIVFFKILFLNLSCMKKNHYNLIDYFKKFLMFDNQIIDLLLPNHNNITGICRGINTDGSLRLELNGKIENIYNGSIRL